VIGPFTDVLREIWPAVTRKVGKIRNRGCRGWILASVYGALGTDGTDKPNSIFACSSRAHAPQGRWIQNEA